MGVTTCAQLVNNINALFLTHEERFLVTPNFYVFGMYAAHPSANAPAAEFSAANAHHTLKGKPQSMWGLNGSASRKGNVINMTVVEQRFKQTEAGGSAAKGRRTITIPCALDGLFGNQGFAAHGAADGGYAEGCDVDVAERRDDEG